MLSTATLPIAFGALGMLAALLVYANILKTQERIEKILGLKVNISNKKNNSGKITIEYKDLDQFELISNLLTKN